MPTAPSSTGTAALAQAPDPHQDQTRTDQTRPASLALPDQQSTLPLLPGVHPPQHAPRLTCAAAGGCRTG